MLLKNYKFVIFLGIIIIILIIFNYNLKIIVVSGKSMVPTLKNNQVIIANKKYKKLDINDIIVFKIENKIYVKRIMAKEQDNIKLNSEGIFINNVKILNMEYNGENKEYDLKEEEFFVLGDNYLVSNDSREFGLISKNQIIAKL